jgi:hypothetical protein
MAMRPRDTSDEAARIQRAVWARMGPSRKLELTLRMCDDVRELSIQGELSRHPGMSRDEATRVVVRRVLGDALFEAAFGER